MGLADTIAQDVITAMKAGDKLTVSVLRMVRSKIQTAELGARAKKRDKLSESDVLDVVSKYGKQLRESIESFEKAERADLADASKAELEILARYLPAQMEEDEIRTIVKAAVKEIQASGPKDMGAVMKVVMPQVKGKADGKIVNQIVRECLS